MKTITLSNNIEMPMFGLGTFRMKGEEAVAAMKAALDLDYPMIDTAKVYENEDALKTVLSMEGVDRKKIWITSKVWTTEFTDVKTEVKRALEATGAEYFDLYLMHWPRSYEENAKAWAQMEEIYEEGLVRAIGVSNFQIHHLDRLLETAKIKPMINQVEAHVNLPQTNLQEYCEKFDCVMEAYCPLMEGDSETKAEILEIAEKHGATPQQIALASLLKRNFIVIPKSVNKDRIEANKKALEIVLDSEDMEKLKKANKAKRYYPCPDNHKF